MNILITCVELVRIETTVTVDPPPEPAISVPNSQSVEFTVDNSTPYITRSGRECKKPARFMD